MAVRLDIRPGEGTISRRGGVAAWVANDIASELRERLLALLGSSDAPQGRAMLRRVAGLIVDAPDAESGIGFGVLAQETDALAVLLHGRVSVAAERGARLTGADLPTWLDTEIPLDGVIILGPGTPEDLVPSSPLIVPTGDLPDGLGSGGGLVVHVLTDVPEPTAGVPEPEGGEFAVAAGLGTAGPDNVPAAPEEPPMEPAESTSALSAAAGGAATAEYVAPSIDTSSDLGPSDEPPFEPPSSEPLASDAGLPYEHVPTHAPPAYESPIADEPVTKPAAEAAMDVGGARSVASSAVAEPPTSSPPFDEEPAEALVDEEEPAAAPFNEEPAEALIDEEPAAAPFDEEPPEALVDEGPAAAPLDQEPAQALFDEEEPAAAPFDQERAGAIDPGTPVGASELADEGGLEPGDSTVTPAAPTTPPAVEANEDGVTAAPGTAMISAVVCELGHVNDPRLWECMVCGRAIPPQHPVTVVQPSLGVLVLDDGSVYELDRGYVVGRAPEVAEAVQAGLVRALTVPDPEHLTSRAHLEVRLEEWDVVVADLGSANGTFLWNVGDADWARLIPHQGVVLRPGGQLAFGRRSISFERALPQ